jgi:superfamily II DNA helicase RecQ
MSFRAVTNPDPARVKRATERLCHLWNVPNLRPHQEQAGINMVKGVSTLLDVPTGGGKTFTFWWPLLYHWAPDDDTEQTRKNILVISPLVALMGEQANDLIQRGIPAIALTSETPNLEEALKVCFFALSYIQIAYLLRILVSINSVSPLLARKWLLESPSTNMS